MKLAIPFLVFLFTVYSTFAANASGLPDAYGPRDLDSFLVYAKGDISAARSDYQGSSGAGGTITLTDFLINGALLSGRQVSFLRGTVAGTLYSALPSRLTFATARGSVRNAGVAERARTLSARMDLVAARAAALPATASARRSYDGYAGRLDITAARDLEVVDVGPAELEGVQNLVLHGNGVSRLIVRVHGADLRLVGGFFAEGIRPSQILFFFPEATHLALGGGGARDAANGTLWGIPGSVLAPCALVDFSEALLTGQLYAGAIRSTGGGQVNAGGFELLPSLLAGCETGCSK